jgi:hypothetical protein
MKIRTLKLTPEQLVRAIQGKASINSNYPSDMELLDLKYDLFTKQVLAVVRSDSFEDIAESYPIPEMNMASASVKPLMHPSLVAKVQPKPVEAKPTIKTQPQPQISQDTGQMEKEFSPEQRKLLRFTGDEDFVIVKPIQFLKTEWDDINDIIVGLGGRWVKGDIINYWEIPRHQN